MEAAASVTDVPTIPTSPPQSGRRGNRGSRRGGERGRRGRGGIIHDSQDSSRGRGGFHGRRTSRETIRSPDGGRKHSSARDENNHDQAANQVTAIDHPKPDNEDIEAEVCFICASPVVHNSVAPCNHRTCHICALRLRALYKTKACAHCRASADFVVFTDDASKRYEDFTSNDFAKTDTNLGIRYENLDIFEDTVLLLRYNCPDPSCDIACYGWRDLHGHVRATHHKVMCDLCTRNKKVFTHEHELFTHQELRKHEKFGDDNPGAIDQSGFKGHPECGFCRQRFYGDDELYEHCRDKHERCHICDRRQTGVHVQYYLDYNDLEMHFRKDHFLCPDQDCIDKKFVVFESEMDLKAHQLETHPNGLSKDARKDARRVDMSGFDYRAPHQEQQSRRGGRDRGRGDREGRGRGRGRDPNTDEPLPVSSAQPMRRDELAYQRQMAIQSAQSVSNRSFGNQLTSHSSGDAFAARAPQGASAPSTITAQTSSRPISTPPHPPQQEQPPASLLNDLSLNSSNLTPADRARATRHAAVIERASNLLSNNASSVATFRAKVSAYNHATLTAPQLVEAFFTLFDTANTVSSTELGTLIRELADVFENADKRDALLKAWNDWRAINEDYPSLPVAEGASSSTFTTLGGGKRILKLKSSTAQSSRSNISRQGSWGSAFPPMAAGAPAPQQQQPKKAPAWVQSASATSSARASPAPVSSSTFSRPATNGMISSRGNGGSGSEAFPSLPSAQKPSMSVSRPGYIGAPVRRNAGGSSTPPVSAWGSGAGGLQWGGSASASAPVTPPAVLDEADAQGKKGKGKGKKGEVLFHWG